MPFSEAHHAAAMSLSLNIGNGFVSAFYFIFLDLILLTNLDSILSRFLSHFYYRKIYNGEKIKLRTGDIPGVTNFIVGSRAAKLNILALCIKLLFISFVFILDFNIFVKPINPTVRLLSTFGLGPIEFGTGELFYPVVVRSRDSTKSCFELWSRQDRMNNSITFYHMAFNLTNGNEYLKNEIEETPPIGTPRKTVFLNRSTITCLSPRNVQHPKPLVTVVGCSLLGRNESSSCNMPANINRKANLYSEMFELQSILDSDHFTYRHPFTKENYTFQIFNFQADKLQAAFPEYVGTDLQTSMFCMKTAFFQRNRTVIQTTDDRNFTTWCLLKAVHKNETTLYERWDYNHRTDLLSRAFAGPVFNTLFDSPPVQLMLHTMDARLNDNWLGMSQKIVLQALVYQFNDTNVTLVRGNPTRTIIPTMAVALFAVFTLSIVCLQVMVRLFVDKGNHHPQINTINGVSSIGREERFPTGYSLHNGETMELGFAETAKGVVHFGPLRGVGDAVKCRSDFNVVWMHYES